MKDQIQCIRFSNGEVSYRFVTTPGGEHRMTEIIRKLDGNDRSVPLEHNAREHILTEAAALLAEETAAPAPPVVSEILLADRSRHFVDPDKLYRLLEDAWIDGDMIVRQMTGPQLMGLVAAPTCTPPNAPMNGFMGMVIEPPEGTPQTPPPPASVWTDDGHWDCACGQKGCTGKFCPECGNAAPPQSWDCPNCGTQGLKGRFCPECGSPRP